MYIRNYTEQFHIYVLFMVKNERTLTSRLALQLENVKKYKLQEKEYEE